VVGKMGNEEIVEEIVKENEDVLEYEHPFTSIISFLLLAK